MVPPGAALSPYPSSATPIGRKGGKSPFRRPKRSHLRRLLLEIRLPLAERGEAVHAGTMGEGALRRGRVLRLAAPGLLRRRLQGAAVREGELPRRAADLVDGVEMGGRFLVRLAAGEERDSRHGGGHAAL